jgi:hypothetical protein
MKRLRQISDIPPPKSLFFQRWRRMSMTQFREMLKKSNAYLLGGRAVA